MARPHNSYRPSKRNFARKHGIVWRALAWLAKKMPNGKTTAWKDVRSFDRIAEKEKRGEPA